MKKVWGVFICLILNGFIFGYLLWIFAPISHRFAVGGSRLKAGMTEVRSG
ncbi:hypothetical protein [Pseudoalteromonas viridis]|uniref:Uncharacterized protein n=1 Tax=Pseudoalteromonas viridis TaxID=339617 RepID=A0ABX7VAL7_9GAMM|nr:hypothetical protein [Pseudoalteromonas viridis]QTL37946.1 hypothetical protein J5X90_19575 [Pseudoalteromonas viridis]